MSDPLTRLHRISRPMSILATVALVGLPLGYLIAWLTGVFDEAWLRARFEFVTLPDQIAPLGRAVAYGVGAASLALVVLALWHMRALFSLFAMGDVFGPDTARRIRLLGWSLLALAGVSVLGHTLSILALTAANPPGQRSLSIGLSSNEIFFAFAAGLLIAIGWAMSEAARLSDENRSFV